MHIDFTVSLGNLITIGCIAIALWRFETVTTRFLIEHEMLVRDYCQRQNIQLKDLPTRFGVGVFKIKGGS